MNMTMITITCVHLSTGSPTKTKPDDSDYKYADNADNCDDNDNDHHK